MRSSSTTLRRVKGSCARDQENASALSRSFHSLLFAVVIAGLGFAGTAKAQDFSGYPGFPAEHGRLYYLGMVALSAVLGACSAPSSAVRPNPSGVSSGFYPPPSPCSSPSSTAGRRATSSRSSSASPSHIGCSKSLKPPRAANGIPPSAPLNGPTSPCQRRLKIDPPGRRVAEVKLTRLGLG